MVEAARITSLNQAPVTRGDYLLYWMQASQRSAFNPALEHAVARANQLGVPVLVCFGLMDDYPEANERHYAFMLEGLADAREGLAARGIGLVVRRGSPPEVAGELASHAAAVVCDRGYLRHQRAWRDHLADHAPCRVEQVEGDAVVPVETTSNKAEFAARTIRPKINRLMHTFVRELRPIKPRIPSIDLSAGSTIDVSDPARALAALKVDRSVGPVDRFRGGQREARRRLSHFAAGGLARYREGRREPSVDGTSTLSPYLHFGQISPVEIALRVRRASAPAAEKEAFLEELIVRRELAMNFVFFTPRYDRYDALPAWARKTLAEHRRDKRPFVYTRSQLEQAATHDPYWNAAQREMTLTGFMHNSMRMYWGKKVLEWARTPESAFDDLLYLNNRYFLCGRDPVSYANVGWIFGLHDRPWATRPVFGTVRYMNAGGLERKFDMDAYVRRWK